MKKWVIFWIDTIFRKAYTANQHPCRFHTHRLRKIHTNSTSSTRQYFKTRSKIKHGTDMIKPNRKKNHWHIEGTHFQTTSKQTARRFAISTTLFNENSRVRQNDRRQSTIIYGLVSQWISRETVPFPSRQIWRALSVISLMSLSPAAGHHQRLASQPIDPDVSIDLGGSGWISNNNRGTCPYK